MVKNLPAMQETWIPYLVQEDSLGKDMATHSSILTWRIRWTEEPAWGPKGSDKTERLAQTNTVVPVADPNPVHLLEQSRDVKQTVLY